MTTGSHCIEAVLPINYDLPIKEASDLVRIFLAQDMVQKKRDDAKAQEDAQSKDPEENGGMWRQKTQEENDGPKMEKKNLVKVWEDIAKLMRADAAQAGGQLLTTVASDVVTGLTVKDEPQWKATQIELHVEQPKLNMAQLEIDLEASQNLVKDLQNHVEDLMDANQKLREDMDEGALGRLFGKLHGDMDDEIHKQSGHHDEKEDVSLHLKPPANLAATELWLSGHFVGSMITKHHFVDINLPVRGVFAGAHAAGVFHHIADGLEGEKELLEQKAALDDTHQQFINTWSTLAKMIQADYSEMQEGSSEQAQQALEAEVVSLRASLDAIKSQFAEVSNLDVVHGVGGVEGSVCDDVVAENAELKTALMGANDKITEAQFMIEAIQQSGWPDSFSPSPSCQVAPASELQKTLATKTNELSEAQAKLTSIMVDNLRMQCEMDALRERHAAWSDHFSSSHLALTACSSQAPVAAQSSQAKAPGATSRKTHADELHVKVSSAMYSRDLLTRRTACSSTCSESLQQTQLMSTELGEPPVHTAARFRSSVDTQAQEGQDESKNWKALAAERRKMDHLARELQSLHR